MKRWWALMGLGVAVTMGPAPSLADEPMVRGTTSTFRASPTAASIAALVKSDGYYRIPYADGTKVKVNRNHDAHTPRGRYDMVGTGGSKPYRIVAAAPGRIVALEDSFSAKQDSATASQCNNNYVWIEHPNGEWSKYSHMQKSSTTVKAKLKVGDSVTAGQYLGDEGSVGCASGDHLHFEIGQPRASDPITSVGGFLRDNADSNRNRLARICGVSGGAFQSGETYQARSVPAMLTPGSKEVARHGLPIRDYQCLYDQARTANYDPVLLDMFDVGGETYVNAVFRPKTSGAVRAFHGLTAARYQAEFDKAKADGYRPVIIESYLDGGVRYAAVFKQTSGVPYSAYHGRTVAQHDERVADLKAKGYVPVSVSVVSDGGRKYTALWEKRSVGWELKSQLTPAQYQTLYDSNKAAGRHVAFLNGYEHAGNPYIAAIFTSSTPAGGKQRHGMTGAKYQTEWSSAMGSGLSTRTVTGYATGNTRTYAASWR